MEFHEAIRRRAMVRSFSAEPVDAGVVDRLLEAALRAPTAGNTGGTAWVVLEGPGRDRRLLGRHHRRGLAGPSTRLRRGPAPGPGGAARLHLARRLRRPLRRARQGRPRASARGRTPGRSPTGTATPPSASWRCSSAAVDAGLGACVLGTFRGEAELAGASASPPAGSSSAPWCSATPTATTTAPPRWTARARGTRRGSIAAAGADSRARLGSARLGPGPGLGRVRWLRASAPWTGRAPAPPASAPWPTTDPTAG